MIDDIIQNFYEKYDNREEKYNQDHSPRLDFTVKRFNLLELENKHLADFGGGYGFLFQRLKENNNKTIFDGAEIDTNRLLSPATVVKQDLNQVIDNKPADRFDTSFCFEVLEHLENPYRCLVEIKELTKTNGEIYLSVPDVSVWHNTPYPTLIFPHNNFEIFLSQMALPILDYAKFTDGWHTHIWKCRNADWREARMIFPKQEVKFFGKQPVQYTNL